MLLHEMLYSIYAICVLLALVVLLMQDRKDSKSDSSQSSTTTKSTTASKKRSKKSNVTMRIVVTKVTPKTKKKKRKSRSSKKTSSGRKSKGSSKDWVSHSMENSKEKIFDSKEKISDGDSRESVNKSREGVGNSRESESSEKRKTIQPPQSKESVKRKFAKREELCGSDESLIPEPTQCSEISRRLAPQSPTSPHSTPLNTPPTTPPNMRSMDMFSAPEPVVKSDNRGKKPQKMVLPDKEKKSTVSQKRAKKNYPPIGDIINDWGVAEERAKKDEEAKETKKLKSK